VVGLPWTSDQFVSETATYAAHNKHKRQTPMSSAGLKPVIPSIKRLKNYALDLMATGINSDSMLELIVPISLREENL
jgi:hypothetical protein